MTHHHIPRWVQDCSVVLTWLWSWTLISVTFTSVVMELSNLVICEIKINKLINRRSWLWIWQVFHQPHIVLLQLFYHCPCFYHLSLVRMRWNCFVLSPLSTLQNYLSNHKHLNSKCFISLVVSFKGKDFLTSLPLPFILFSYCFCFLFFTLI